MATFSALHSATTSRLAEDLGFLAAADPGAFSFGIVVRLQFDPTSCQNKKVDVDPAASPTVIDERPVARVFQNIFSCLPSLDTRHLQLLVVRVRRTRALSSAMAAALRRMPALHHPDASQQLHSQAGAACVDRRALVCAFLCKHPHCHARLRRSRWR